MSCNIQFRLLLQSGLRSCCTTSTKPFDSRQAQAATCASALLLRGMPSAFVPAGAPVHVLRARRRPRVCSRGVVTACTGGTGGLSEREAEIKAKIDRLRSASRLQSQRGDGAKGEGGVSSAEENASLPGSFNELPDWKKEEVLERSMREAEGFFGVSSESADDGKVDGMTERLGKGDSTSSVDRAGDDKVKQDPAGAEVGAGDDAAVYKPKVGTWGMFPRPDNISKAYGGGRKIPIGGALAGAESAASKERDAAIKAKLASYRASAGIDMAKEEAHAAEISAALATADRAMRGAFPADAVRALEPVCEFVSTNSQRGGEVYLALALAYEATGQRNAAIDVYKKLRASPFQIIARKARQLLAGFDAMEALKVEDAATSGQLRVGKFQLPDVAQYTDKRYETSVYVPKRKGEGEGARAASKSSTDSVRDAVIAVLVLACLVALPLLALKR